jgi:hypothetical protein
MARVDFVCGILRRTEGTQCLTRHFVTAQNDKGGRQGGLARLGSLTDGILRFLFCIYVLQFGNKLRINIYNIFTKLCKGAIISL